LQHLKELGLHTDLHANESIFYFTTCGWMMWNWLVSSLALQATPVLFEGDPTHPSPAVLWDMADACSVTVFGASAKYVDTLRKASIAPRHTHQLKMLRTICSTGSPLLADSFKYVYSNIKADVQLASISGGTDIVSCFVLGNPLDKVRLGEIQCRGLGMTVDVYDDAGQPLRNAPGEFVCTTPFPSMPVMFWDDEDGTKYYNAYFSRFQNVWAHGDWATLTAHGSLVIHGRSDATLNPSGVRIGTAEIYRPVEAFDEIAEALAVGQEWQDDQRVILFVRLAVETVLDDILRERLRTAIRQSASPRHVPAKIIAVADMPRTRSGKISEIAVRDIIHNRSIKNLEALTNPETLDYFKNLSELQG
jgi:acetoacetyl-CoA synthetase